ncbi:MAG: cytochrome c biogenesis protein CcsA [Planctomycetes bacterium]|nr:cytochrome c biogenesis protein CcsA [Planctomycetota bacterium]MCC7171805.1 cytochrome c biogenesis protein CcsA [Planctomycetota bacterium]
MIRSIVLACVMLCAVVGSALAQNAPTALGARRLEPWTESTRKAASTLAIQDGGRIKPLSTFARFFLLRLSAGTTLALDSDGKAKLQATDFVLDCLFFQEQAMEYPVILVEDYDVLDAVGLGRIEGKRKRDRYSYNQLAPCFDRLFQQANQLLDVEPRRQTPIQKQIVNLARNVDAFVALMSWQTLTIVPPPAGEKEWLSPIQVRQREQRGDALGPQSDTVARLTAMRDRLGSMTAFQDAFLPLTADLTAIARERGEVDKIAMEAAYYDVNYFGWARWLFAGAFVFAALVFLSPKFRPTTWLARGTMVPAELLLCVGITIRCIVRDRPPVSTLYETILFITAIAVLVTLIIEWLQPRRIAQLIGAALGFAGMSLAGWYEEISGTDTMPQLQAVLDTNFWLSTHVTTVTMGYAAGLLASAISMGWVLVKTFVVVRGHAGDTKLWLPTLTRMAYGTLCFGALFSTVGTILGGIWANESWGRFWGWDPKENGALMIVLGILVILHARIGGYVRERGLHVLSILLGCIVVFSWFHTNQLGVGLHAYGFDEKLGKMIDRTYMTLLIGAGLGTVVGIIDTVRERQAARAAAAAAAVGTKPVVSAN